MMILMLLFRKEWRVLISISKIHKKFVYAVGINRPDIKWKKRWFFARGWASICKRQLSPLRWNVSFISVKKILCSSLLSEDWLGVWPVCVAVCYLTPFWVFLSWSHFYFVGLTSWIKRIIGKKIVTDRRRRHLLYFSFISGFQQPFNGWGNSPWIQLKLLNIPV